MAFGIPIVFNLAKVQVDLRIKVVQVMDGDRFRKGRQLRTAELISPVMTQHDVLKDPPQLIGERLARPRRNRAGLFFDPRHGFDDVP